MPALNLELLQHEQLSILGYKCLVKEAIGQILGVCLDKHIAPVQAAEQPDYCVKSRISLLIIDTLQTLLELVVAVGCHVIGGQCAFVHEVLE